MKKKKSITAYVKDGVVGNAKAIFGIDKASGDVFKKRLEACLSCDRYKHWMCEECGCIVRSKIAIASESCPIGLWEKEERPSNGKAVESA